MPNASVSSSFRQALSARVNRCQVPPQEQCNDTKKNSGDGWISKALRKSISLHHLRAIKEVYLTQKLASNTGNAALLPAFCPFLLISKIFMKVNTF